MQTTRRDFLKLGAAAGAGLYISTKAGWMRVAGATAAAPGLSDPAFQPKFAYQVPDAMAPSFKFRPKKGRIKVAAGPTTQYTGLVDDLGNPLPTALFGYGTPADGYTWPGRTFELQSGESVEVKWENRLQNPDGSFAQHLLPVDTSLHWAYSLHGYEAYNIDNSGIPIVSHVHGGHTDFQFDGNPEYFFSPGYGVRGPQWRDKNYVYRNDQPAGTLWYHDHALGITRLNVYAGLAGFYILRDEFDTGLPDNPLGLPAWPYEKAYAIQDRMFNADGSLFYPAFPGDPFYDDFITGEGAILPPDLFPGGGPTALAEFFGDHMVVNGVIWPKEDVEARPYRFRLLNGTDSRFLVIQFRAVPAGATDPADLQPQDISAPLPFTVIGSDQGLASSPTEVRTLVFEPGGRYDVVFDFSGLALGSRIIMTNIGGDAPFGGDYGEDLGPDDFFPNRQTDRIMAFDVVDGGGGAAFAPPNLVAFGGAIGADVTRVRKVALFEGMDEFGRLQPLLGTAEPATDFEGKPINWPATPEYVNAGLVGQMNGAIAWHSPTTENPALGSTEIWEIYNATGDAHPVHLHLVHFEVLDRREFTADVVEQPIVQHNGLLGNGFRLENIELVGDPVEPGEEYVENAPKDMVTALPGQVTRIKATFDKPGRYVWHCHILSHEDHEMMRVLHVGPGA